MGAPLAAVGELDPLVSGGVHLLALIVLDLQGQHNGS